MLANRLFQTIAILALFPLCLSGAERLLPKLLLDAPTLKASEKFVLAQVVAGKIADLKTEFANETNRVLRAAFLEALLTQSGTNVHRNGFSIEHAVVLDVLDLRNAVVHYETRLVECRFAGEANFSKSIFENGFSLTGSIFEKTANFSSMKIERVAVFDKTTFAAGVSAGQLEITGMFSAREAHFTSPIGPVDFTSLKTGGDAFFSNASFAGRVTFQSAHILENCRFDGSVFTNAAALVNFEEVRVGAASSFVGCSFAGYVSFKDAKFNALDFSKTAWPRIHDDNPWLWLNGMTYTRISAGSEKDSWKNLFNLVQRTAHGTAYSADVFSRFDDYYRKLGYPREANAFFRAQKKREREEVLSGPSWVWSFFLEQFVGYGRSPERAIFWSVAIIGFGCVIFQPNRMEPQKSEFTGRKYSPFWYSVDVYLPIIKLHDADVWKPKEEYILTHVWRRIHTVLGWALIPIALAAWTGMLSR
ncbi:MAG: pentapeptide repeat-containing protein [Verrucomicrobiota bacterium]